MTLLGEVSDEAIDLAVRCTTADREITGILPVALATKLRGDPDNEYRVEWTEEEQVKSLFVVVSKGSADGRFCGLRLFLGNSEFLPGNRVPGGANRSRGPQERRSALRGRECWTLGRLHLALGVPKLLSLPRSLSPRERVSVG